MMMRWVILSACSRDLWILKGMDFRVFGIGCTPVDSKGRIDVVTLGQATPGCLPCARRRGAA